MVWHTAYSIQLKTKKKEVCTFNRYINKFKQLFHTFCRNSSSNNSIIFLIHMPSTKEIKSVIKIIFFNAFSASVLETMMEVKWKILKTHSNV